MLCRIFKNRKKTLFYGVFSKGKNSTSLYGWMGIILTGIILLNGMALPTAEAAILIGTEQEVSIGRQISVELEKNYGLVKDQEMQSRIARIGQRLVVGCDRKDLTYSFKVLDQPDINALALPGGYIYVFRGLVEKMPSDEELAGVLGHELGHVVKRHSIHQMEKSLGATILFALLFGDKGMPIQNLVLNAIMAGYSRGDEKEADRLGVIHTLRAGYNPYSMLLGLYKLGENDKGYKADWFSSHPDVQERIQLIASYTQEQKVHPYVERTEQTAVVKDGTWSLPPVKVAAGGYKSLYRAYFLAGELYLASLSPDFGPEKFILDTDGENATIYYDDRPIFTLMPADVMAAQSSLMELANQYVTGLQEWARQQKGLRQLAEQQ